MINAIAHPVEIYEKKRLFHKNEWRWRITANNGKIIASSSEGYHNREDLIKNMASISTSLLEFLTEEKGGVTYHEAKVTLNKIKNESN